MAPSAAAAMWPRSGREMAAAHATASTATPAACPLLASDLSLRVATVCVLLVAAPGTAGRTRGDAAHEERRQDPMTICVDAGGDRKSVV
mgnify:CR=1 FL=1